jgi:hypothetical protein
VKAQNDKMMKQQEHLQHAKNQVEEELVSRQSQLDELAERMLKQVTKHRQKALEKGVEPSTMQNGTIEEKAVKAEVYKTVIQVSSAAPIDLLVSIFNSPFFLPPVVQNVLYTLSQLAIEFPEVSETLSFRLQEADLRLPSKPPAKGNTTTGVTGTPSVKTANSTGSRK